MDYGPLTNIRQVLHQAADGVLGVVDAQVPILMRSVERTDQDGSVPLSEMLRVGLGVRRRLPGDQGQALVSAPPRAVVRQRFTDHFRLPGGRPILLTAHQRVERLTRIRVDAFGIDLYLCAAIGIVQGTVRSLLFA